MTTLDQVAHFAGVTMNGHAQIRTALSRNDLPRLFAALGYTNGAEVGVWAGDYALVLCHGLPGLRLRCVDPWLEYASYQERKNNQRRMEIAYAQARAKLEPYRCVIDRRTSMAAAQDVPDASLDFVYIDGNHAKAFVLQDLAAWVPKVRSGGMVSGHDYSQRKVKAKARIEVKEAVDEYVAEHGIAPVFVASADKAPSFFWVKA
jgi:predicted O-methyltransferase YrrM